MASSVKVKRISLSKKGGREMRVYRLATLLLAVVLALAPISVSAKWGEFTSDDYFRECTTTNPDWRPKSADEQDRIEVVGARTTYSLARQP